MKAILIIWLWNGGELAMTSEPMPNMATCNAVKTQVVESMDSTKYLKGMNRGTSAMCFEVAGDD